MVEGEQRFFAHELDPDFKEIFIFPISDVHYGNPLFSKSHFDRTIAYLTKTPNAFTVLNGDLCESAIRSSKGDVYKQVGTPQDQWHWIAEQLRPLAEAGKVLGMTTGNHEDRIYKDTGIDISKEIAGGLGLRYKEDGILLKVSFGGGSSGHPEKPFSPFVYATHGYGGARTKGAKAVKVERASYYAHAHLYIMSHDHLVNASPDVYLMPDTRTSEDPKTGFMTGKVVEHIKVLVKSNAYIKWGGYSERGGFPPVSLETPKITCQCQCDWCLSAPQKDIDRIRVKVEV